MPIQSKIPTILLTGFLGSGKTTLLNRLIQFYQSQRTVLLINEFGQIGIDGELLIQGNYEKIELNKGSLFCICVRTDFIEEVRKIACQIRPDLLIIEATGLADTSEMEKMLALPDLIDNIHLHCCICLVDCQTFLKIKDNLRAPATQILSADLVLINKIDLVSVEQVTRIIAAVREFSLDVPILQTRFAEFDLKILSEISHPLLLETDEPGEGRPDLVISVTLEGQGSFSTKSWNKFLDIVRPNLLRLKGFITLQGRPHHLDMTMESYVLETTCKFDPPQNRLVLIGQNFDEDQIKQQFLYAIS
ncbi:GTP-binding protein [candidate division KSB1 bacterium]|nr:GTP-binding protein [candidate division KSB1 bacterium]